MKFLNKKEQVMDFKLTSYGHYLLSIGRFKPVYYGFYDDNVLYDGRYAAITESANSIHNRIKESTPYMESQVLFEEVEGATQIIDLGSLSYYEGDITPVMMEPRRDVFKWDRMIGDAYLEGETNIAPAWKVVLLGGEITSTQQKDAVNEFNIPQLNVQLTYRKKINQHGTFTNNPTGSLKSAVSTTPTFADGRSIQLIPDDLMFYVEEANTVLLVDNFDIEVFEVATGSVAARCPGCSGAGPETKKRDLLHRRYFKKDYGRIGDGLIDEEYILQTQTAATNKLIDNIAPSFLSSSVSYYFDVKKDKEINPLLACRGAELFNKKSYYVDLDFDCDNIEDPEGAPMDIYGAVTEPNIC